jgi:F0F1-type ATP synthase alpha subunit
MQTGIMAIDAMIPLAAASGELIIGDRRLGRRLSVSTRSSIRLG